MLRSHLDVSECIFHVSLHNNEVPTRVDDQLQDFLEACVPHLANAIRNLVVHRLAMRVWEVVDSSRAPVMFRDQVQLGDDKRAAGLVHRCHTS